MAPSLGWGHEFFQDHPSAKVHPKVREAYSNDKMDRKKIFCSLCWISEFSSEVKKDEEEMAAGLRTESRSNDSIIAFCSYFVYHVVLSR